MELELGLALPNINQSHMIKKSCKKYMINRFVYDDDEVESKDSSLLVWSGQPNEDDDDGRKSRTSHVNEIENDEEEIVGWPPINSWRKEALHRHHGALAADDRPVRNSMFVKVKMAGVPIGRKIDLTRFHSYQALTHTLINMFVKYTNNKTREGDYTILYQDNEGDWLLAGDVPWEIFVESVHRMEIRRNAN
ncbi:hypothetical protein ACS0TY_021925 [Phlomoides rotata]